MESNSRKPRSDESGEVLPLVGEELNVRRVTVETGQVEVAKHVRSETRQVDEPVFRETVDVQRVPIGREIDAPVEARQEGDTLIVPLLEERLVLRKQLVLVEEVRITRKREQSRQREEVTLRREEAEVKRLPGKDQT